MKKQIMLHDGIIVICNKLVLSIDHNEKYTVVLPNGVKHYRLKWHDVLNVINYYRCCDCGEILPVVVC